MEVCSDQVEYKVSAKRLWKVAFADAHNALPKALPHAVSHVSYEGAPAAFSAGAIRTIHFHASFAEHLAKEKNLKHPVLILKEKLEEVDHQALKLKVEPLQGGFMGTLIKHAKVTMHIKEGDAPNTCVFYWSFEYEAVSEEVKPRVPLTIKEYFTHEFKHMEEYLLSHDDYKEE